MGAAKPPLNSSRAYELTYVPISYFKGENMYTKKEKANTRLAKMS